MTVIAKVAIVFGMHVGSLTQLPLVSAFVSAASIVSLTIYHWRLMPALGLGAQVNVVRASTLSLSSWCAVGVVALLLTRAAVGSSSQDELVQLIFVAGSLPVALAAYLLRLNAAAAVDLVSVRLRRPCPSCSSALPFPSGGCQDPFSRPYSLLSPCVVAPTHCPRA